MGCLFPWEFEFQQHWMPLIHLRGWHEQLSAPSLVWGNTEMSGWAHEQLFRSSLAAPSGSWFIPQIQGDSNIFSPWWDQCSTAPLVWVSWAGLGYPKSASSPSTAFLKEWKHRFKCTASEIHRKLWLELKWTQKLISFHPCHGRVTFQCPRVIHPGLGLFQGTGTATVCPARVKMTEEIKNTSLHWFYFAQTRLNV